MDSLTIFLVLILLFVLYLGLSKSEKLDITTNVVSDNNIKEYQTNEVDYHGKDVETRYFNQLQKDITHNERQYWEDSQKLESDMQTTHKCSL